MKHPATDMIVKKKNTEQKTKKMGPQSLKSQMVAIFLGLIVIMLILIFVINATFLGKYYEHHKQTQMREMYELLNEAASDGTIETDSVQETLQEKCDQENLSVLVVQSTDGDEMNVVFYTEREQKGMVYVQMLGYIFGEDQGELIESEENYSMYRTRMSSSIQGNSIDMYGSLSDGSSFFIQSRLESIQESAALANQFLITVGCIMLILGAVFIWFFSRKITEPLMELVGLSKRMADLDFDAKYTSGGDNEIGILGENFNTMSRRLEEAISDLKSANNQLQKDIEQKEKMEDMRNEFIGNVSHELKTPIALIQGYAEGLKEGVNDDSESREFYCDVIMDEAGKMNQMVKNLLTLNQLEFGAEELTMERFDVAGLVRGVVASCEILLQQAGAKVDFIAPEKVYVWADEFKTEQVVRNYLTNAIHHTAYEKRIEIRIIPQGDTVRITVFNSGNPIPEEDVEKLWDKFYKVDKAHTREYGGNGIGLSIVKAIMESFHQDYGVRNFDNGVEFWFELDSKTKRNGEETQIPAETKDSTENGTYQTEAIKAGDTLDDIEDAEYNVLEDKKNSNN